MVSFGCDYESVTDTANRYGLPRKIILEFCNSPGQKFAFKPNGGKFWIHKKHFHEYLERRRKNI